MIDLERVFTVSRADGSSGALVVRFFDSSVGPDDRDWRVSFSVSGLESQPDSVRTVYGIDELQAFMHALRVARAVVESSAEHRAGAVRWLGTNDLGWADERS